MNTQYPPYPRESAGRTQACIEVELAVRRILVLTGRRLPGTGPTIGDFFAAIRARGEDTYFLSENPGP